MGRSALWPVCELACDVFELVDQRPEPERRVHPLRDAAARPSPGDACALRPKRRRAPKSRRWEIFHAEEARSGNHRAVPRTGGAGRLRRRPVREGGPDHRVGRSRKGRRQDPAAARDQPQGRAALRQPRQAARGGQGRSLQCLRMGQLFAGRGHQGQEPPGRPPLDRHLCGPGGARGFAGADAAAIRQPADRRAVLLRHSLFDPADAGRFRAARPDQARPRAQRLALPVQAVDGRSDRRHHA